MTDHPVLAETDALALSRAACLIEQARAADPGRVAAALDHNVAVWKAIGAIAEKANGNLPEAVKANLGKLGAFVIAVTPGAVRAPADATCDALININRQVSAGLLNGQAGRLA